MTAPDNSQLLALWEHDERRHPLDRALLLYAFAAPETPSQALADAPLGTCNTALMRWHQEVFGTRLSVWADCPACGERMEFELDSTQLPPMMPAPAAVEVAGQRFRCPSSRDLAQIAGYTDVNQAANRLLQACASSCLRLPSDEHALRHLREAVEDAIETADPWADLSVLFQCPACEHRDEACFDVARYVWEDIDARARHLLNDVHLLAQAYGWSEPQILALSDTRRAAYLAWVCP
jgi:hypothetical protein